MVTWSYLAGFFDGEVCISQAHRCKRTYTARLTFSQSKERGRELLEAIREFLIVEGCSPMKVYNGGYSKLTKAPSYQLQIAKRRDVSFVLNRLYPFLNIKKLEAQDFLRLTKLYPPILGRI